MSNSISEARGYIINNFLTSSGKINCHIFRGAKKEDTSRYLRKLRDMFCLPEFYSDSDVIKSVLSNDGKPFVCNNETCNEIIRPSKKYCSLKCSSSSTETKKKRRETSLSKFGTEHPMKSNLVKNKVKKTNIGKYGSSCPLANEKIRKKAIDTWNSRLGVSHPMKNKEIANKAASSNKNKSDDDKKEIRLKYINTCLDRYGVSHPSKDERISSKIISTNIEKYGARYPFESKEVQDRVKLSIRDKYGVDNVSQVKEITDKKRNNNRLKYGVPNISQKHMEPILGLLSDKEYWMNEFINKRKTSSEICHHFYSNYGVQLTEVTVLRYAKKHGLKIYSYKSKAEIEISDYLSDCLGVSNLIVGSSRGEIIPKYCVDIYIPDHKLAIDFNGLYWHSNKDRRYHLNKTKLCEERGIRLLHIFENEWADAVKRDIWKSIISSKLGKTERIYARKCKVVEVCNKKAKEFATANHIQGHCNASVRLGLEYGEELVSLITLGKPRFDKNYDLEILRFCSKKGYTVVGGFSKLISRIKHQSLISYGNRRWCSINSNLYKSTGFDLIRETDPNYFYTRSGNLYNRLNFQKYTLKDKLEYFDYKLTEIENMEMNGYRIIYDCGNLVYHKK